MPQRGRGFFGRSASEENCAGFVKIKGTKGLSVVQHARLGNVKPLHPSAAPDHLDELTKDEIHRALSDAIHAGVSPLTPQEWRTELEAAGFTIAAEAHAPMHLLEPRRLVQNEGLGSPFILPPSPFILSPTPAVFAG